MAVALRSHEPERRRRPTAVAACGCCCCCCCLHSIAGLVAPAITESPWNVEEQKGTAAYWWCLVALVGATIAVSLAGNALDSDNLLLILAILLPAIQLAAALAAAVIAHFLWGKAASRRVGRLAWRAFVGALIGLGVMAAPLYAMAGSGLGAALSALGVFVVVWLCIVFRKGARRAA